MVLDDLVEGLGMGPAREAGELLRGLVDEFGCGVLMSASDLESVLVADRVWSFGRGGLRLLSDQSVGEGNVIEFPTGPRHSLSSRDAC